MKLLFQSFIFALLLLCSVNAHATTEEADAWMKYLFGDKTPIGSYPNFGWASGTWQEKFTDVPTDASFEDAVKLGYRIARYAFGWNPTNYGMAFKTDFGFTSHHEIPPEKHIWPYPDHEVYVFCYVTSVTVNDFSMRCYLLFNYDIAIPDNPINLGDCEECDANKPSTAVGNPINVLTGNKFQKETDFSGMPGLTLGLQRFYNSHDFGKTAFGSGWRNTYDRSLNQTDANTVLASRADGRVDTFKLVTGIWQAGHDVTSQLTALLNAENVQTGWKLMTRDDTTEIYTLSGQLASITTRAGLTTSLSYDADNRLSSVLGPFGQTISFAYDTSEHVSQVTDPAGGQYQYAYDSNNNLVSVTYPDGKSRQYHYEVPLLFVNDLTGITDENGVRFATYAYDSRNRAISSEHVGDKDKVAINYDTFTTTDALGNSSSYSYTDATPLRKLTGKSTSDCSTCGSSAYSYDSNGFKASQTDFNGNITTYTRDTRGLELSRTEASGTPQARTVTTTWHATYHLPLTITEPNRTTTFTYDAKGNLLTKTITGGGKTRSWSYTYNSNGQILTETDPRGKTTTYTYNGQGGVATTTNPMSQITSITSYDANGRPLQIEDPNGLITTLVYDARGRLISLTSGTEVTSYTYDAVGQLTKVTLPNGAFVSYTYDPAHRLTGIADALENRIAYTLDAMGNRTKEEVFDAGNALKESRTFAYDSLNRLAKSIDSLNQETVYGYDPNSNVTSVTDPLNRTTHNAYDPLNRLIQSIDPNNKPASFGYNVDDLPANVIDPRGVTTSYGFDELANPLSTASPDSGTTTRTFDAAGNVLTATDARDKTTSYSYDDLGRMISAAFAEGEISYQYDQGTNGKGRLTKITDPSGSTEWSYDLHGRVTMKVQKTGTVTLVTTYQYDATTGKLLAATYPSGKALSYSYGDVSGLPTAITVGGQPLLSTIHYQPFGEVSAWNGANGSTHTRDFDQDGRISNITITGGGSDTINYTYDAVGRITQITDTLPAPQITTGNSTHAYASGSNRLATSTGDITQSYSHDAAGNIISDGSHTYAFDGSGRMSQVSAGGVTTTYAINGLGQRVKKSNPSGTTIFAYDEAGHLIGEYDANGTAFQETVWLGDLPVAVLKGTNRYYINPDHLGAPRSITDQTGTMVWRWLHDPYGNGLPVATGQNFVYNLRFPGQYYDAESGLHYNYYRDYNPMIGRYVQSDPIGLAGGLNTYGYVRGNPVMLSDRTGELPVLVPVMLVGATGGMITGGIEAYSKGARGLEFGQQILQGGVSGTVAMLAALAIKNPLAGAAYGSYVNDILTGALRGEWGEWGCEKWTETTIHSVIASGNARAMKRFISGIQGGSNFNPLKSNIWRGPKAIELYKNSSVAQGVESAYKWGYDFYNTQSNRKSNN